MIDVPEHSRARNRTSGPEPWSILGWFGLGIFLIGLLDMALVWYPVRTGNPAWEFGAVDGSMASAPVVLVGLMGVVSYAFNGGKRWVSGLVGVLAGLLMLGLLVALFVYWTSVPLALSQVPEQAVPGITKSIVRTSAFGLVLLGASAASSLVLLRVLFTRTGSR